MKEIKAFIHPHRAAAVIAALRDSGVCDPQAGPAGCHLAVSQVQCVGMAVEASQQHYSVELAEPVMLQTRLELVCDDDVADAVVEVIVRAGHTGQAGSGWVHVRALEKRVTIE
ncbi:MAG: P-II family nitrogen regulator [Pseudomonadota bacterium]|jgi:nitrogen regulatory protein P-II 1